MKKLEESTDEGNRLPWVTLQVTITDLISLTYAVIGASITPVPTPNRAFATNKVGIFHA